MNPGIKDFSKVYEVKRFNSRVGVCGYNQTAKRWEFMGGGKNFTYENKERMEADFDKKGFKTGA